MITSTTCVITKCVHCGETDENEWHGTSHFESADAARRVLTAKDEDHQWRWGAAGPECPGCVQELREQACAPHEWVREPDLPFESLIRFRECRKCGKSDGSRDQGKTWISDTPRPRPATPRESRPGGTQTVSCFVATCDGCGTESGDDYCIHYDSIADAIEAITSDEWVTVEKEGKVLAYCLECGPPDVEGSEPTASRAPCAGQGSLFADSQERS